MLKTRKRWISLLVALTFLLSLLPAGAAFGAEWVTFLNTTTIVEKAENQPLGYVRIKIDPEATSIADWVYATVELPSGVEYVQAASSSVAPYVYTGEGGTGTNATIVSASKTVLTAAYDLVAGNPAYVWFKFADGGAKVNISSSAADEIVVKVTVRLVDSSRNEVCAPFTYNATVGKVVKKEVTATAASPKALAVGKSSQAAAEITIKESEKGALSAGESVYLELPSTYFRWASGTTWSNGAFGLSATRSTSTSERVYELVIGGPSFIADTLKFTPVIDVLPGAPEGDVTVNIRSSDPDFKETTLVIGQIGAPTVTVTAASPKDVWLGRFNQEVAKVTVKANAAFGSDKWIALAAPAGVKFNRVVNHSGTAGGAAPSFYDSNKRAWANLDSGVDKFEVTVTLDVYESAALGDLKLTVSSNIGASGDVVVAKVLAPATVTADVPNVLIGETNQPAGDITITETKATSLSTSGAVYLTLPDTVKFADELKYKINDGSEQKTSGAKDKNQAKIDLSLTGAIDTIKIYGIKYRVASDARGDIEVALSGNALSTDLPDKTILKVVNAKAVTPTAVEAVLTIGSTTMTVNGKEVTMDVAPYLKDGRTFLPVRFAANAVGVSDTNIIWDGATQKVIILKGDRIVQMTVGDKTLMLNNVSIPMDVAPEVVPPGRTMLPIRFLAIALGADITWNPDTQTVTISVK